MLGWFFIIAFTYSLGFLSSITKSTFFKKLSIFSSVMSALFMYSLESASSFKPRINLSFAACVILPISNLFRSLFILKEFVTPPKNKI